MRRYFIFNLFDAHTQQISELIFNPLSEKIKHIFRNLIFMEPNKYLLGIYKKSNIIPGTRRDIRKFKIQLLIANSLWFSKATALNIFKCGFSIKLNHFIKCINFL